MHIYHHIYVCVYIYIYVTIHIDMREKNMFSTPLASQVCANQWYVGALVVVTNAPVKSTIGKERVYLGYNSRSQSIILVTLRYELKT